MAQTIRSVVQRLTMAHKNYPALASRRADRTAHSPHRPSVERAADDTLYIRTDLPTNGLRSWTVTEFDFRRGLRIPIRLYVIRHLINYGDMHYEVWEMDPEVPHKAIRPLPRKEFVQLVREDLLPLMSLIELAR